MATARDVRVGLKLDDMLSPELSKAYASIRGFGAQIRSSFQSAGRAISLLTSPLRTAFRALTSFRGVLLGLGVAFSIRGAYSLIEGTAAFGDQIQKMSLRLGVSTEALSELEYAVRRSGGSLEDIETAFRNAQKNLEQFASTGTGEARYALEALSVDFNRLVGQTRNMEDLLPALSQEFKRLSDTERVFVASKLFGRSGTNLIPLLTDDIEELRRQARELGLTLSQDAANDAAKFEDALLDVKSAFEGLKRTAVLSILPDLTEGMKSSTRYMVENKVELLNLIASTVEGLGSLAYVAGKTASIVAKIFEIPARIIYTKAKLEWEISKGVSGEGPGNQKLLDALVEARESLDLVRGTTLSGQRESLNIADEILRKSREAAEAIRGAAGGGESGPRRAGGWEERTKMVDGWRRSVEAAGRAAQDASGTQYGPLDVGILGDAKAKGAIDGLKSGFFELQRIGTDTFGQIRDAVIGVGDSMATNLSNELLKAAQGTQSLGQAFGAMAKGVLADIAQMTLRMAAFRIIGMGVGALGGLLSSGDPYGSLALAGGGSATGSASNADLLALAKAPNLFGMAEGGIAYGPRVVGEAGKAEAYIPLGASRRVPVEFYGGGGGGMNIGTYIHIDRVEATDAQSFERRFNSQLGKSGDAVGALAARTYQGRPSIRGKYQ